MTTETINLEALEQAVLTARQAESTAKEVATEKIPTLLAASDFAGMTALTTEITKATKARESAESSLSEAKRTSRWASLEAPNQAIQSVLQMIIDRPPVLTAKRASGVIRVDEQGNVSTDIRVTFSDQENADLEALVSESVDVDAFLAADVKSLDISVDLTATPPMITLRPTEAKHVRAPRTEGTGTRAGALEYEYNGEWLSSKAFLTAVEASGHAIATDRAKGFERALRGDGNAMSNLAKDVASKLSITSRSKPKE